MKVHTLKQNSSPFVASPLFLLTLYQRFLTSFQKLDQPVILKLHNLLSGRSLKTGIGMSTAKLIL